MPFTFRQILRYVICGIVTLLLAHPHAHGEAPKANPRTYAEGPLKIEEFRGPPDRFAGGDAYTATKVHFEFKWSIAAENGVYTATLTSFDAYAVFLPEKSWWTRRAAKEILDHEQGHFDIAEMTARRLQLVFGKVFAQKQKIQTKGPSRDAATKALEDKLNQIIKIANDQTNQDDEQYDAITRHGMRYGRQAEFRRVQKATLKQLAEKLDALHDKPVQASKSDRSPSGSR